MPAKRNQVLKSTLGHQLTSLCKTRWVERHEGVIQFRSEFSQIVKALTLISVWKDAKTSTIATTLLNSLCTTEFLLSMLSLIDILKITLSLSRLLQMSNLDANGASTAVSNTMSTINEKRKNCEQNFDKIYKEATEVATGLDIEIKLPRLAGRQTKRENYPEGKDEYYRRSIYIPLFDNVSNDLSSRLRFSSLDCFGLRGIIPSILAKANRDNETIFIKNLETAYENFSNIIGSRDIQTNSILFEGELTLWKNHWKSEKEKNKKLSGDIIEVLDSFDLNISPTIRNLLRILATLPVSVATAKRSFSTLRRVKTWLRARMGEERLTGLCLLHVHRDVTVDIEKVIERFAKNGNRPLEFIL
ncbi:unnamed protein product [Psylliodes chrysocephalus]|uniref:HAT C-terminal dimerisation domain-containing protein n=1 Tax=Psylliodes chrysocephalus TaxID=3402493 RepID=A0A9P0D1Q5_9CUCU|nr:unnamed protein product [Psylliodes chrysocephala]